MKIANTRPFFPRSSVKLFRPADTGLIAGYFITGGSGARWAAYRFAHLLLPQANVPVLLPRTAADQEFPDHLTPADLKRLGIPEGKPNNSPPPPSQPPKPSQVPATATTNSLRFINRITGK